MKISTKRYCASCHRDFRDMELVWYMSDDNDTVCGECKRGIKTSFVPAVRIGENIEEGRKNIMTLIDSFNEHVGYMESIEVIPDPAKSRNEIDKELCKRCKKTNDLSYISELCSDCCEKQYDEQLDREIENHRAKIERY